MALLDFVNSQSLLPTGERQSRFSRVKSLTREGCSFSAGRSCVQRFALGCVRSDISSETRISELCLPPAGFSTQGTADSPARKFVTARAVRKLRKPRGRRVRMHDVVQSHERERQFEVLSQNSSGFSVRYFVDSPTKKIQVCSETTWRSPPSSSGLEWTNVIGEGLAPQEHGTASDDFSDRKRRSWQHALRWNAYATTGALGSCILFGFWELHTTYLRHHHGSILLECAGGGGSGHSWGSGGGWNSKGGGGDSGGGDKLGPEDFHTNGEDTLTKFELLKDDIEEEEQSDTETVHPQLKYKSIFEWISSIDDQKFTKVPLFASLSSSTGDTLLKDNIDGKQSPGSEDCSSIGIKDDSHIDEGGVSSVSNGHESGSDFLATGIQIEKPLLHGHANAVDGSHGQSSLHGAGQELGTDSNKGNNFKSSDRAQCIELIEKKRAANLESLQSSTFGHTNSRSQEQHTDLFLDENRESVHTIPTDGNSISETDVTTDSWELYKTLTGLRTNEEKQTTSRENDADSEVNGQPKTLDSISSICMFGWPRDALHWLARLVHSIVTRKREPGTSYRRESDGEGIEINALVDEVVSLVLKQLVETEGPATLAKHSETECLRRLQHETLLDLLKIRGRLDKVEQLTGLRRCKNLGNPSGVTRTQLKGEVKAGTAIVLLEDISSRYSCSSLEQAGMQTGVNAKFTFETPFRERDLLVTQCVAGQAISVGDGRALGGPISVEKVLYSAHISDGVSFSIVPLGAQGKDLIVIINPLQDQALSEFSSNGAALFNHCKGSAVGATVSGSKFSVSIAQYLSGWGNRISTVSLTSGSEPLRLSTLCQFLFQPSEWLIFSVSGLNQYWPSPPLPSSVGLHWSEMGPLILPKIHLRHTSECTEISQASTTTSVSYGSGLGSSWVMPDVNCCNDSLECKGTALQSIALAAEVDLGGQVSAGGWAQIEGGDWLRDLDAVNVQWAVSLAKSTGSGIDWGVCIGDSRPDFWSIEMSDHEHYPGNSSGFIGESYSSQLQLEAFLKFYCGRGLTLQPGLLYVLNKYAHTPALILRSSWTM